MEEIAKLTISAKERVVNVRAVRNESVGWVTFRALVDEVISSSTSGAFVLVGVFVMLSAIGYVLWNTSYLRPIICEFVWIEATRAGLARVHIFLVFRAIRNRYLHTYSLVISVVPVAALKATVSNGVITMRNCHTRSI